MNDKFDIRTSSGGGKIEVNVYRKGTNQLVYSHVTTERVDLAALIEEVTKTAKRLLGESSTGPQLLVE